MSVSKVEWDVGMSFDPRVVGFELVNAQIIEDDVDFIALMRSGDRVHEVQKFLTPSFLGKHFALTCPVADIKCCKTTGYPVPLVFMGETGLRPTVRHFEPSLLSVRF